MRLSEALRYGITLRPESHQERFCNIENRGLCSDAWGAAIEAEYSTVAYWNWNPRDPYDFERCMEQFRKLQHHFFGEYFNMPARCPLAQQRFIEAGGRIINRQGEVKIEGEKVHDIGGATSECNKVDHLAGFIDHAFYAHGWSREQVAEAVEWYEQTREQAAASSLVGEFQHYQVN
jgi:hypothetical protein